MPRLAGRVLSWAVAAARAQNAPVQRVLATHLGSQAAGWPVVTASWPAFDQVNVQTGVDAWLAGPGLRHELLGLTGVRHGRLDLADLTAGDLPGSPAGAPGIGSVTTAARPAGPGGITRACVTCGLYLVEQAGQRSAVLLRGPADDDPHAAVSVQVTAADQAAAGEILDQIRTLATTHNLYRGQVISFDADVGGPAGSVLGFLDRPRLDRATVILPPDLLDGIERQVLGIARHSGQLSASGQHLRRGVLLHGPPGTGKTHMVRYLIGQLPQVTAIVISGAALRFAGEACAIARTLQPSIVVVEDVELAAESRGPHAPLHPSLLRLLIDMEAVGDDGDVTFLLTTNRADLLEEALAARPGQVDLEQAGKDLGAKLLGALQCFRKDCVGASFHVPLCPINRLIEILDGARVRPRDDHKIGIAPRSYRRFDSFRHLFNVDQRFSGQMSAALGKLLVFDVTTGQTCCFKLAYCACRIFQTSKSCIRIHDRRNLHRLRDVPVDGHHAGHTLHAHMAVLDLYLLAR